jgi:hypothetical protein
VKIARLSFSCLNITEMSRRELLGRRVRIVAGECIEGKWF